MQYQIHITDTHTHTHVLTNLLFS